LIGLDFEKRRLQITGMQLTQAPIATLAFERNSHAIV
jgi:hypothetical protein